MTQEQRQLVRDRAGRVFDTEDPRPARIIALEWKAQIGPRATYKQIAHRSDLAERQVIAWMGGRKPQEYEDVWQRIFKALAEIEAELRKGAFPHFALAASVHQAPHVHPFARQRRRIAELPPIRAVAA